MDTKVKYSASKKISKDNVNKSVNVEEVENGFIITVEKNWHDAKDNYKYETKKYISKENPFDTTTRKEGKGNDLGDSLESFLNDGGDVEVIGD
jgi:protein involved in sex pheromone biosynthesis